MSKPRVYGSHAELSAAADMYNFDYCLFHHVGDKIYSCTNVIRQEPFENRLFLLFTGPLHEGHFRFLKPIYPRRPDFVPAGNYKLIYNQFKLKIISNQD